MYVVMSASQTWSSCFTPSLWLRFTNGHGHADSRWLSSLERVDASSSPVPPALPDPAPTSSSPPVADTISPSAVSAAIHSPRPLAAVAISPLQVSSPVTENKERDHLRVLIQDQARVIANLEAEKSSLLTSVAQLEQLDLSRHFLPGSLTSTSKRSTLELQQTIEALRSEQSKTEKLQDFLQHAESDVEQLSNQIEEQKVLVATLETEKGVVARQLIAAKTGKLSTTPRRVCTLTIV